MNFEDIYNAHKELESRIYNALKLASIILKTDDNGIPYALFDIDDIRDIDNGVTLVYERERDELYDGSDYISKRTFIPKEWIDSALDPINLPEADDNEGWATYETRKKESEANIAKLTETLTNIKIQREKKQEEIKTQREELNRISLEEIHKKAVEAEKRQYEALKAKYEGK